MIRYAFKTAQKRYSDFGWLVEHPSNGGILAYCETEKEADEAVSAIRSAFAEPSKEKTSDPDPISEASEKLEKAEGAVAHALQEVWHSFRIIERRGERCGVLPIEGFEVLQDVMKAWGKASNAFLAATIQDG